VNGSLRNICSPCANAAPKELQALRPIP